jgi:hypothetical protein
MDLEGYDCSLQSEGNFLCSAVTKKFINGELDEDD